MIVRLNTEASTICGALMAFAITIIATTCSVGAQSLRIGGTGSALGTMRVMAESLSKQNAKSPRITIVPNLGTQGSIRALQAGAIDVALIGRPLNPDESAAGLVGFEYGRSPTVFVTSKTGVSSVTAASVANILSGYSNRWPDGSPVRFVLRPKIDGDNVLLAALSIDIAKALEIAHQRPGMIVAETDQEAADAAERLPGSLVFSTLALILSERRQVNIIPFNGVTPSTMALSNGSYPHYKALLIVTQGAPRDSALHLVDYFKSPHGRAILESNGHWVKN